MKYIFAVAAQVSTGLGVAQLTGSNAAGLLFGLAVFFALAAIDEMLRSHVTEAG